MSVVGLLFLLFEEAIISESKSAKGASTPTARTGLPRIITGVQVNMHHKLIGDILADECSKDRTHSAGNGCHKIKRCFSASQGRLALWQPGRWVVCLWCSIRVLVDSAKTNPN